MSLILEALRKIDRERSFRRRGAREIAVEMLRSDASRRRTDIAYWGFGILVIFFAGISIILTTYPGSFSKSQPSAIKVPGPVQHVPPSEQSEESAKSEPPSPTTSVHDRNFSSSPSDLNANLSSPSPPASVINREREQKASSGSLTRETAQTSSKDQTTTAAPKTRTGADEKTPAIPQSREKPSPVQIPESPAVSMPAQALPAVPVAPQKPTPVPDPREPAPGQTSLKIWAIAWNEVPAERMVVMNGIFLTEGATFEGVKVLEILPDSVRLLRDGQAFELAIFPK